MADPVSYSMFAPTVAPLDLSPISEAGRTSAAAILGAGQAIAEGLNRKHDEDMQEEVLQDLEDLTNDLSNSGNYVEDTFDAFAEDPELVGHSQMERVAIMEQRLIAQGVSPSEAAARAKLMSEPITFRYLKPDKMADIRSRSARVFSRGARIGMGPEAIERMLDMAGGNAAPTREEGRREAFARWSKLGQPADANNREMAAIVNAARTQERKDTQEFERQQATEAEASRLRLMRAGAGLEEEAADNAFDRFQEQRRVDALYEAARDKGESKTARDLLELKVRLDRETAARIETMSHQNRMTLAEFEKGAAIEIAELKGAAAAAGGGLTPTQARQLTDFKDLAFESIASGEADQPIPLEAVAGLVGGLSPFLVKEAKKSGSGLEFLLGKDGTIKASALNNVTARIGPDGDVVLEDPTGEIKPEALEKMRKSIVRNDAVRDAVAVSQVAGGLYKNANDLEVLRMAPDTLKLLRKSLSRAKAPEAAAPKGPNVKVVAPTGTAKPTAADITGDQ